MDGQLSSNCKRGRGCECFDFPQWTKRDERGELVPGDIRVLMDEITRLRAALVMIAARYPDHEDMLDTARNAIFEGLTE